MFRALAVAISAVALLAACGLLTSSEGLTDGRSPSPTTLADGAPLPPGVDPSCQAFCVGQFAAARHVETWTCGASACAVKTCQASFADCDGLAANGCESDGRTDGTNCGTCGKVCPSDATGASQCVRGTCSAICTAGRGDCNLNTADGCEINLNDSTQHCGTCGHDCLGGACTGGACQPSLVASLTTTPVEIGADDKSVYVLATDGGVTGSTLQRFAPDGGGASPLAQDRTTMRYLIADGTSLFWIENDSIYRLPAAGGVSPARVAASACSPSYLRKAGETLFWASACDNVSSVAASASDGSPVVASSGFVLGLAGFGVGPTAFYLSARPAGMLVERPRDGGAAINHTEASPTDIATSATSVYWTTTNGIRQLSFGGGSPSDLATGLVNPWRLAVDPDYVYFTTAGPPEWSIGKVAIAGGAKTTLFTGSVAINGLTVDATSVYWLEGGAAPAPGSVRRLAK